MTAGTREAHQLPAGRHGLPRAFVVSNQRDRILDAVMLVASRHGYARMRVEDVVQVAGVSRRTFYDHFANKEEAFLAAYDLVVDQLTAAVGAAYQTGSEAWTSKVARALAAFLRMLADEPALAHVCIVDVLAAGPNALARRTAAMERFRVFIDPTAAEGDVPASRSLAAETVIGGIYEVIYARVIDGRVQELPALLPDLLHTVLLPFAGAEVADAESARARARAPGRT